MSGESILRNGRITEVLILERSLCIEKKQGVHSRQLNNAS